MGNVLSINIRIAGREYPIKSPAEEEFYLREAARLINERIKAYRERGYREDQDILAMIAVDSIVARLKGDEYAKQLQQIVVERVNRLDKLVSPVLSP